MPWTLIISSGFWNIFLDSGKCHRSVFADCWWRNSKSKSRLWHGQEKLHKLTYIFTMTVSEDACLLTADCCILPSSNTFDSCVSQFVSFKANRGDRFVLRISFKWHISALQRLSHSSLFGKCSTWLQPPEAGSNFLFKVSVFMVVTTPVMNNFFTIKPNQMSHYAGFSFL